MAARTAILKIFFFASSPEPNGQLIRNLVGSIGVTCRSKIAKIVRIGNQRWPLKNLIFHFSWIERLNLVGSIGVTCRLKIAKTVPVGSPKSHRPGTFENLTECLQNITFIQNSIPVSHVVFKIKSTEKHATIFEKVKPGTRQNSTVLYFTYTVLW